MIKSTPPNRHLLLGFGLVLLVYLLAFHIREATKFNAWIHAGHCESVFTSSAGEKQAVFLQTVVAKDFESGLLPSPGDTVLRINGVSVDSQSVLPSSAWDRVNVEYRHESDTLRAVMVMRPPPADHIWGIAVASILRLLVTLTSIGVGLWALRSRSSGTEASVFALYSFSIAAGSSLFVHFLSNTYASFTLPGQWVFDSLGYYFACLSGGFWLHLLLIYPRPLPLAHTYKWLTRVLCYVPGCVLIFLWFNSDYQGRLIPALASVHLTGFLHVLIAPLPVLLSFFVLVYRYRASHERLESRQLRLILWAVTAGIILHNLSLLISKLFSGWYEALWYRHVVISTIAYLVLLLAPLACAYAFRKYRLMEVESKLRRGTRYMLTTILVIAVLSGIAYAFSVILYDQMHVTSPAPGMILAFFMALTVRPVQRRINQRVEKSFYPERTELRKVFKDFLNQASTFPDQQDFWNELSLKLRGAMNVEWVRAVPLSKRSQIFEPQSPLLSYLSRTQRTLPVDEALAGDQIELGSGDAVWLRSSGAGLLLPLVRSNQLVGLMAIGMRRDNEDYDSEVLQILNAAAPQLSLAVENLRLLEENFSKKRMEEELALARRTQENLLPQRLPDTPGLEIAARCVFCLEVAGDYWDVIPLPGERTALVIADVSGKGAAAALLTASLQASLHTAFHVEHNLSVLVGGINNLICRNSSPEQFITFFLAVFDPAESTLSYINAGHNAPILINKNGTLTCLESVDLFLGCVPNFQFHVCSTHFKPGSTLLMYTDGASEATNSQEEFYGESRLESMMSKSLMSKPEEILEHIYQDIESFHGQASFDDDLTMLVVRARE